MVDGALAEILRLPDHTAANSWIVAARRYLAGRGALDRVETAALLEPAVIDPSSESWAEAAIAPAAAKPSPPAPASAAIAAPRPLDRTAPQR